MREIKFRGKRLDNGEWVYGGLVTDGKGNYAIAELMILNNCNTAIVHMVDPATVGEYTGLKDKNGKEIYEGDVVDRTRRTWCTSYLQSGDDYTDEVRRCVCAFAIGKFILEDVKVNKRGLKPLFYLNIGDVTIEIIGNIHDNPEIINQ